MKLEKVFDPLTGAKVMVPVVSDEVGKKLEKLEKAYPNGDRALLTETEFQVYKDMTRSHLRVVK